MASFYTDRSSRLRRPIFRVANQMKYLAVRAQERLNGAIRHVHGPEDVDCAKDELVVLCLVRDGEMWIESFIRHHLELGAKHIFFLDNGSTDSTVERAKRHDQVSLWSTNMAFRIYEQGMRRWLTRRFGDHRWSLTCDVDELFDYPYSDRLDLSGFLHYLNHHSYTAVAAQMLDMFSERPFSQLSSHPEDSLQEKYRYYDLADLSERRDLYWIESGDLASEEISATMGGIRKRIFGSEGLLQTKHPLVFANDEVNIYPYDVHFHTNARVADVSAVLLHYKFLSTLEDQVHQAFDRSLPGSERTHPDDYLEKHYRGFHRVLSENRDLSLRTDSSSEFHDTTELVDEGYLVVSDGYREWIESRSSVTD